MSSLRRPSFSCLTAVVVALSLAAARVHADPPTALNITVVDRASKAALADADVDVRIDNERAKLKTDADGKLVVDLPEVPKYIGLTISKEGFSPMAARWDGYNRPIDFPPEQTIALPEAAPVGGVILDADGKPAPGSKVYVAFDLPGDTSTLRSALSWETAKVDDQGRWSVPNAPADFSHFSLCAFHMTLGGNDQGYYNPEPINDPGAKDALHANKYEFRLPPVRAIKGKVTDKDGNPIAGVEVTLGDSGGASNTLPPVKSDGDGNYAIGIVPDADVILTFKEIKHAPELVHVKNTATLGDFNMKLGPAQPLKGRVVNAAGEPVARADVSVASWRGARVLSGRVQTNDDGYFIFRAAPADEVQLSVYAEGFAEQSDIKAKAGTDALITLAAPVTFTGTVVDADTKKPVTKFNLVTGIIFNEQQPPTFQRQDRSESGPRESDAGTFTTTYTYPYPGRIVRVEADGYAPLDSPKFSMKDGNQTFTFEMHHAEGIKGIVQNADGSPAAGVDVYLVIPGGQMQVINGVVPEYVARNGVTRKTGADGTFVFPPQTEEFSLYANNDAGSAIVTKDALSKSSTFKLEPWAVVSGKVYIGSKPAGGATVQGWSRENYDPKKPMISRQISAVADAEGKYTLDHVPAGDWNIGRMLDLGNRSSTTTAAQHVAPKPGEHVTLDIGNKGRPVVGKIEFPDALKARSDWEAQFFNLSTKLPKIAPPKPFKELRAMTKEQAEAYQQSPEWKAYLEAMTAQQAKQTNVSAQLMPDGSFRFDDVEPGTYVVRGNITKRLDPMHDGPYEQLAAITSGAIVVPAGSGDEAFETKDVVIELPQVLDVGKPAPAFDLPTLDGKKAKLADLKGKFVLLHFLSTGGEKSVADLPALKKAIEPFKADDRLTVISIAFDPTVDETKAFAAKNEMTWTIATVADEEDGRTAQRYQIREIPSLFLIGPDGNLIAKGLTGETAGKALADALKAK